MNFVLAREEAKSVRKNSSNRKVGNDNLNKFKFKVNGKKLSAGLDISRKRLSYRNLFEKNNKENINKNKERTSEEENKIQNSIIQDSSNDQLKLIEETLRVLDQQLNTYAYSNLHIEDTILEVKEDIKKAVLPILNIKENSLHGDLSNSNLGLVTVSDFGTTKDLPTKNLTLRKSTSKEKRNISCQLRQNSSSSNKVNHQPKVQQKIEPNKEIKYQEKETWSEDSSSERSQSSQEDLDWEKSQESYEEKIKIEGATEEMVGAKRREPKRLDQEQKLLLECYTINYPIKQNA